MHPELLLYVRYWRDLVLLDGAVALEGLWQHTMRYFPRATPGLAQLPFGQLCYDPVVLFCWGWIQPHQCKSIHEAVQLHPSPRCAVTRAARYEQKMISRYFLAEWRYTIYISIFSIEWVRCFFSKSKATCEMLQALLLKHRSVWLQHVILYRYFQQNWMNMLKKRDVFHLLHKIITYAKQYKAVGYTH